MITLLHSCLFFLQPAVRNDIVCQIKLRVGKVKKDQCYDLFLFLCCIISLLYQVTSIISLFIVNWTFVGFKLIQSQCTQSLYCDIHHHLSTIEQGIFSPRSLGCRVSWSIWYHRTHLMCPAILCSLLPDNHTLWKQWCSIFYSVSMRNIEVWTKEDILA